MNAAGTGDRSGAATTRSGVTRMIVTLLLSVCALSLLLIALTVAFHLVTRYDWYFADSFQPWRVQTVEALGHLGAPLLGALIVWRQPTNRYGWVWCLLGLASAVQGAAFAYELWAWYVAPVQPFGYEAAWLGTVTDTLYFGLLPLALHQVGLAAALPPPQVGVRVLDAGLGGAGELGDARRRSCGPCGRSRTTEPQGPGSYSGLCGMQNGMIPAGTAGPGAKRHDDATAILCRFMDPSTGSKPL